MSRRPVAIGAALLALGGGITWFVLRGSHHKHAAIVPLRPAAKSGPTADRVAVRGAVYDQDRGVPIGGVRVVLLATDGTESAAISAGDGSFAFTVARGRYRAFVRDDEMISVGLQERMRLDQGPRTQIAGVLDPRLAPMLDVETDLDNIELTVTKAAVVTGKVVDYGAHPIVGALVRMRQPPTLSAYLRPVLGTDTAITDDAGNYTLRLPAGEYEADARHHDFAGLMNPSSGLSLAVGQHAPFDLTMVKGCFIRGKVVRADGKTPGPDGAIEVDSLAGVSSFGPQSRVAVDGTFELALTSFGMVRVRAWPWKSAPSQSQAFDCDEGRRFEHVTLQLQDDPAEIGGTLVDADGALVPFTYVDLKALDPGVIGQQERSDAGGVWHIYDTLPGRYTVTATAEGRGIVEQTIIAPKTDVELHLSGTGRISGTTTELVNGSLEVAFLECGAADPIELAPETRIVPVVGGHFVIDNAPACSLTFYARWRERTTQQTVVVEPKGTAYVTLALGAPRDKSVHGIVRDWHGAPAIGVRVTAVLDEREAATVRTDKDGRYTMTTKSGAQIIAGSSGHVGRGVVGRANIPSEEVDLVLDVVDSQ